MDKLLNIVTKIKVLFSGNRKLLIPLIPLIFFVLLFIFTISLAIISPQQPSQNEQEEFPIPTSSSSDTNITITPPLTPEDHSENTSIGDGDGSIYVSPEESSNFQRKEPLVDGTIKYYTSSGRPERPNITITSTDGKTIFFLSSISSPTSLPQLSEYINYFGQPERIVSGSKFYGTNVQTYIYAQNQGFAFIANKQTNTVLETHQFTPMSVEEYINKYGQDIIQ